MIEVATDQGLRLSSVGRQWPADSFGWADPAVALQNQPKKQNQPKIMFRIYNVVERSSQAFICAHPCTLAHKIKAF
jgi:hypothetical protein